MEVINEDITDSSVFMLKKKVMDGFKMYDFNPDTVLFDYFPGLLEIENYWTKNIFNLGQETETGIKYAKRALKFVRLLQIPGTKREYISMMTNFTEYFSNLTTSQCTKMAYIGSRE